MFIDETEKPLHQLTKATTPEARERLRAGDPPDRVVAIAAGDIVEERTPQSLMLGSSVNSRLHRCSQATPDFLAVFTTPDPATLVGREIGTRR